MTSRMPSGWQRELSQRGVTMTGSFSTKSRIISNEAEPEPMMMLARSTVSRSGWWRASTCSTAERERKCTLRARSLAMPER